MSATLNSIEQKFLQLRTQHTMRLGQKSLLDQQATRLQADRAAIQAKVLVYSQAQELLLRASSTARILAQTKIQDLVTLALSAITGEAYSFRMELVQSAGAWTVQFFVITPAGIELDPIDQCGGGIADICSMALRIAILEMYEPRIEGPILLDENFKFLSREHIRTAVEFIHTLCQKTDRQIILVTHVPELAAGADRCFEVQFQAHTSCVEDVSSTSPMQSLIHNTTEEDT